MVEFGIMFPKVPKFIRKYNRFVEALGANFVSLAWNKMYVCKRVITDRNRGKITVYERSSTGGGSVPYCSTTALETKARVTF